MTVKRSASICVALGPKNPQCFPASAPLVFPGLRPRVWPHLARLVMKVISDKFLVLDLRWLMMKRGDLWANEIGKVFVL